jgi:hypothetical protein
MNLRELLLEKIERTGKGDTAVIGWGRGMGHKGHMMLASSVITHAKELGGDPYFVVSRTFGPDDPLKPEEKLAIYKKVFPEQGHIFQTASDELPDLTRVLTNLNQQGYRNAVVVVGADQVKAFQYLNNYNGKPNKAGEIPFQFDDLQVISRQMTSDPSREQEGPRATPMRQVLLDPTKSEEEQFAVWRDAMSDNIPDEEVRDLMMKAKERMMTMKPEPKKAPAKKKAAEPAVAEGSLNEEAGNIVVRKLIADFNEQMSGSPYYPLDYKDVGMRSWTRGDGSRYKDPGYIYIDKEMEPQDIKKYSAQQPIEKFWNFLSTKGSKKIGDVSGEFGSDPHSPAVVLGKLIFVFNGRNIAWGSVSRLRNSSVWRQKSVKEGDAIAHTAKRLTDPKDGATAKLRAAGDKRREQQMKSRDFAKRDDSKKDQWGDLKTEVSDEMIKRYFSGAMKDTISGKKDRNKGMAAATRRMAGVNKPLL